MPKNKATKFCPTCTCIVSRHDARFCNRACYLAWHHLFTGTEQTCLSCGRVFIGIGYVWRKGRLCLIRKARKTCSKPCYLFWLGNDSARKEKIGQATRGMKNPSWKGGFGTRKRGWRGFGWNKIAEKARKRDRYTCQDCGISEAEVGAALHVHHIEPFRNFSNAKQANALTNLITVCKSCHKKREHKIPHVQISMAFLGEKQADPSSGRSWRERLSKSDILRIRHLRKTTSTTEIAQQFGISQSYVRAIVAYRVWQHVR